MYAPTMCSHEVIGMVVLKDIAQVFKYVRCEEIGSSIHHTAHIRAWLLSIMQHLETKLKGMIVENLQVQS